MHIHNLNPVDIGVQRLIHRDDDLFVVVLYSYQRCEFPLSRFRRGHGLCHLDILFGAIAGCNKVNLFIVQFSYCHFVPASKQLQVYDILQ